MSNSISRSLVAEALGTAMLLATVIGSGIMGERLAAGNIAIALMANTIATGAMLTTLILTLAPISGAHFNPAVTLSALARRHLGWRQALCYVLAQMSGAILGVMTANIMFSEPAIAFARHPHHLTTEIFSEFIAAFGLLLTVIICARFRSSMVAFAVGGYIVAAYWFTSSTSFANPAVTMARALSDTFAGIHPMDVPAFVLAQLLGAAVATGLGTWLLGGGSDD